MADCPTSHRERILTTITEGRLEGIERNNGYRTDLGLNVLVGELPRFGPDDPKQVLAVLPQEDRIEGEWQEGKIPILWPIDIAVLVSPELDKPWVIVEAGLFDVKKAMETGDRTLSGLLKGGKNNPGGLLRGSTETFKRMAGSEAVGALITYAFPYWEVFGDPEA